MEVWHTICMYHGNTGAPGAVGVSHGAGGVIWLQPQPLTITCSPVHIGPGGFQRFECQEGKITILDFHSIPSDTLKFLAS